MKVTFMCSDLVAQFVNWPIEENQVEKQEHGKDHSSSIEGESVDSSDEMEKQKSLMFVTDIVADILAVAVGDARKGEEESLAMSEELLETRTDDAKAQETLMLLGEDLEHEGPFCHAQLQ